MAEDFEEYNERFETIEQTLKYIADSQARANFEFRRSRAEFEKRMAEINASQDRTEKHLQYLSKLVGISLDNYQFQEEKLQKAGEILASEIK